MPRSAGKSLHLRLCLHVTLSLVSESLLFLQGRQSLDLGPTLVTVPSSEAITSAKALFPTRSHSEVLGRH